MHNFHRKLLERSIQDFGPHAAGLDNATIYVTGASGFLASSLMVFLSELADAARVKIRLCASARREMDAVPLFRFTGIKPKAEWQIAPVETAKIPDAENLIVVHTASYGAPKDFMRDPIGTYTANTQGLINLFSQKKTIRHFVYFSSAEIYGQPDGTNIPTPETYRGSLDTLSTRSIYGESKRMAEVLGVTLGEKYKVPFTALRPWNVYGPGQKPGDGRVPMEFVRQARFDKKIILASNGSPTRAFCHVWDAMRQITAALDFSSAAMAARAFNIGNPSEEISMIQLARRCAAATGADTDIVQYNPSARAPGLQRCQPDVRAVTALTKASVLNTIPLDEGIKTLVEWNDFLSRPW